MYEQRKQPSKKSTGLFAASLTLTLLAVCTNFISFVSPYWIQSIPSKHSQFERIGLWTACFNGYMRPGLYDKAYFGCYYIYYVEYDSVRGWINPGWLYGIQTTSSVGILLQFLVTFVLLSQSNRAIERDDIRAVKFTLFGHFVTCITLAASLVAFAVARYDSTWMPYPEMNVLSWSYAVAALSFALTSAVFLVDFFRYLYLEALAERQSDDALLKDTDPVGLSSPPMKEARDVPYTPSGGDVLSVTPRPIDPGMMEEEEDEMMQEGDGQVDFDDQVDNEAASSSRNFNGLDPRRLRNGRDVDEYRPMVRSSREPAIY
ncbi:unnamed protein product [Calicophoron daubneyi]|uniref:Uncharacterized protein n=1 Tax=Calicophoron daubneyi TaxID=300641 RepID=A0AAV2T0X1_CALDB